MIRPLITRHTPNCSSHTCYWPCLRNVRSLRNRSFPQKAKPLGARAS